MLFAYPAKAAFGRVLPKTKVYEHASPTRSLKDLIVRQVEQIVWEYKLAPETINLKATRAVPEIQVFSVSLKTGDLKPDVLRCIDRAISFPVCFELRYQGKVKPIAAYKRPSEADKGKWVLSDYFEGDWTLENDERASLPVALDLESLYGRLLEPLLPHPARRGEGLQEHIERLEQILAAERTLEKCEARLRKEKQFNRKVEINAEIRALRKELEGLTK